MITIHCSQIFQANLSILTQNFRESRQCDGVVPEKFSNAAEETSTAITK